MYITLRTLLAASLFFIAGSARCAEPASSSPAIEVVRAEFGTFPKPGTTDTAFTATRSIPLVPGQLYGWIALVKPTQTKVHWREEFTLPAAPETWAGEAQPNTSQSVSEDRRTSITEGEDIPTQGMIMRVWGVAPGDPAGTYRIRVFIENRLVESFVFEVK
jgi:hypothetical protein